MNKRNLLVIKKPLEGILPCPRSWVDLGTKYLFTKFHDEISAPREDTLVEPSPMRAEAKARLQVGKCPRVAGVWPALALVPRMARQQWYAQNRMTSIFLVYLRMIILHTPRTLPSGAVITFPKKILRKWGHECPHLMLQTPQNYLAAGLHLRTSALLPVICECRFRNLFSAICATLV